MSTGANVVSWPFTISAAKTCISQIPGERFAMRQEVHTLSIKAIYLQRVDRYLL
jgi:hypothetical protein